MVSFSEDEEKQIRRIFREEYDKYHTVAMMYTEKAEVQMMGKEQAFKPASEIQQPKQEKGELDFNPELCDWTKMYGAKGEFYGAKADQNYALLKNYLARHEGRATVGGFFYWLFPDGILVGRKAKQP